MERLYEGVIFIKPTLSEQEIGAVTDKIKNTVSDLKGAFISESPAEKKNAPYEMGKFKDVYYYYIRFNMDPSNIDEFKSRLKHTEEVVRYMIARTSEAKKEEKEEGEEAVAQPKEGEEKQAEA